MLTSLFFTLSPAILSLGAQSAQPLPRPDLDAALASWRAANGATWDCALDAGTGWAQMIYGGRAALAGLGQPRTDADFVALATLALAQTAAFHGLQQESLVLESTHLLPLGLIGTTDKFTVRYRQVVHGVPVEGAFLNLLFSMRGDLLSVQSSASPAAQSLEVESLVAPGAAARIAQAAFRAATGVEASTTGAPERLIAQIAGPAGRVPHLAWKVECGWSLGEAEPVRKLVYVDARDGSVLRMDEGILHFDVFGSVSSKATPGTLPDLATNPPVPFVLPYVQCTAGATSVFSDAQGNFNFPGMSGTPNVSFGFSGTYAAVFNAAGSNYSFSQPLPAGTSNSVLLNAAPTASVTAQANAYIASTRMRDWIRGLDPADAHGDFQTIANTAVAGTCNAYYTGSSINFFTAGGGCSNTAYSTVVSHEQGHWMNDRYGTGNGPDGMGEGNADVWAMYMWDNPIVAENFFDNGGFIRTGTNTRQFCGDNHPGCYGEVHADGEVWMGAAWKVRDNLNTTLGNSVGDLTANELFLGWMNAYNQSSIRSIIETQWVTLDDDDGVFTNGSPHFTEIDTGFRAQGFPGLNPCPLMANVCTSTINSTSFAAHISTTGQNRLSTNNLALYASNLPPNKLGLFFFGQTQTQVPFGNGWRCVGAPIYRLPATVSNLLGDLYWPLDLGALPGGLQFHAGETWYFQAWFRDPAAGGAFFNTSDALQVPWCQ